MLSPILSFIVPYTFTAYGFVYVCANRCVTNERKNVHQNKIFPEVCVIPPKSYRSSNGCEKRSNLLMLDIRCD